MSGPDGALPPLATRAASPRLGEEADAPSVLIFADQADWHVRELTKGFAAAGATARAVSLKACGLAMGAGGVRFLLPDPCDRPPDLVFVKTIAAGSFEEVTLRLGILHGLEAAGCVVVNSAPAIERCVDKAQTSLRLSLAGLPTPPAWTVQGRVAASALLAAEAARGAELVLKPLFGAQGRGLMRLSDPAALPEEEAVSGIYYLQRFVPPTGAGFRDRRVLVSAGRAVAAMERAHDSWITNVHQGARCTAVPAEGRIAELAVAAAAAVGAAHAGVDLIRDAEAGWSILEVNSMPAWKGLQSVTPVPIAPILAADALALLAPSERAV